MGFIIGEILTVKKKVKFDLPSDEGQRPVKADMLVEFTIRNVDDKKERAKEVLEFTSSYSREYAKLAKDPEYQIDIPDRDFDAERLREDIENITGLLNPDKSELAFSAETLEQVLLDSCAKAALIRVWADLNLEDPKRKN